MTPKKDIEPKTFKVVTKPLKFTLDEVKDMIESYFNDTPMNKWTVTGLALLFGSRQTLINYQKLKGYSTMINQAKLMVENKYELMLDSRSSTGAIFALKNFGWVDRTESNIEVSGKDIGFSIKNIYKDTNEAEEA